MSPAARCASAAARSLPTRCRSDGSSSPASCARSTASVRARSASSRVAGVFPGRSSAPAKATRDGRNMTTRKSAGSTRHRPMGHLVVRLQKSYRPAPVVYTRRSPNETGGLRQEPAREIPRFNQGGRPRRLHLHHLFLHLRPTRALALVLGEQRLAEADALRGGLDQLVVLD